MAPNKPVPRKTIPKRKGKPSILVSPRTSPCLDTIGLRHLDPTWPKGRASKIFKREKLDREEKVKAGEELEKEKENTPHFDNGFLKLSPTEIDNINKLTEEEATVPVAGTPNKQKRKVLPSLSSI